VSKRRESGSEEWHWWGPDDDGKLEGPYRSSHRVEPKRGAHDEEWVWLVNEEGRLEGPYRSPHDFEIPTELQDFPGPLKRRPPNYNDASTWEQLPLPFVSQPHPRSI